MRILVGLLATLVVSSGLIWLVDQKKITVAQQEERKVAQLHIETLNGCEYVVQTNPYRDAVTASYPAVAQPVTCKNDRIMQPAKK